MSFLSSNLFSSKSQPSSSSQPSQSSQPSSSSLVSSNQFGLSSQPSSSTSVSSKPFGLSSKPSSSTSVSSSQPSNSLFSSLLSQSSSSSSLSISNNIFQNVKRPISNVNNIEETENKKKTCNKEILVGDESENESSDPISLDVDRTSTSTSSEDHADTNIPINISEDFDNTFIFPEKFKKFAQMEKTHNLSMNLMDLFRYCLSDNHEIYDHINMEIEKSWNLIFQKLSNSKKQDVLKKMDKLLDSKIIDITISSGLNTFSSKSISEKIDKTMESKNVTTPNGIYTCQWSNNAPHGHGQLIKNDNIYAGNFIGNTITNGTITYKNGNIYFGSIINYQINGKGTIVCNDMIISGEWTDNQPSNPNFIVRYKLGVNEGDIYSGRINNNYNRHGWGTYTSKNGCTLKGNWVDGNIYYGELINIISDCTYYGNFDITNKTSVIPTLYNCKATWSNNEYISNGHGLGPNIDVRSRTTNTFYTRDTKSSIISLIKGYINPYLHNSKIIQ